MRNLTAGMVFVCLMTTSAHAGLQSALLNPGGGLRAVEIVLTPLRPIPEGGLFIDPIASTRGEGVFREGPDFEYDSTTGGVTVFAPPLLGPADEFGVRQQYSPLSIEIFGRDFFADVQSIPKVTTYRRGEPDFSQFNWQSPLFEEDDSSFAIDEYDNNFNLYRSSESIRVNAVPIIRGFSGIEISFQSLLAPGLRAEVFEAEEDTLLPNSIWPYLPSMEGALPNVHFVVDYGVVSYSFGFGSNEYPRQYSLLAVPQAELFQAAVPEPSSVILALLAAVSTLLTRRTQVRF
ncbi:MAG: hypothetical protein GXP26_12155 [Planctomycetes bacterium]|nr:hypothetical protein [Planctomycetota bacterium]